MWRHAGWQDRADDAARQYDQGHAEHQGGNGIDPQLLRVSATLGIRGWRFHAGVLLAAALPGIVTGLKLGWS